MQRRKQREDYLQKYILKILNNHELYSLMKISPRKQENLKRMINDPNDFSAEMILERRASIHNDSQLSPRLSNLNSPRPNYFTKREIGYETLEKSEEIASKIIVQKRKFSLKKKQEKNEINNYEANGLANIVYENEAQELPAFLTPRLNSMRLKFELLKLGKKIKLKSIFIRDPIFFKKNYTLFNKGR